MQKLAGKLALVTGGSSGIELATAKAFVANGAPVAITGRDPKTLDAAKAALGGEHLALSSDTADLKAIDALRDHLWRARRRFANAGVSGGTDAFTSHRPG